MNQRESADPGVRRSIVWPFRPVDALIVVVVAVTVSVFAFDDATSTPSWAALWSGAFLGQLIASYLAWRRARAVT